MRIKLSLALIAAQGLPLVLLSKSFSLPRASLTSLGVVLTAGQSGNNSAAVVMVAEALDSGGRCTLLYAPLVERAHRFPLSPETEGLCTALTATLRRGVKAKEEEQLAFAPHI